MAEKEYIEREAAKNILLQHQHRFTCADEANGYGSVKWSEDVIYLSEAVNGIDAIPAADVRPVVLCKDCMYAPSGTDGGKDQGFALEWPHDEWPEDNPCPCKCEDGWYSHKPKPDFFCANGKREES